MKRIPSLDGLRAISISLVVVGHYFSRGQGPKFLGNYASLGVQVFFVISGYLITTILLRERQRTGEIDLKEFYVRRAFRILPAAVVFMLFASVAYWGVLRWYNLAAMLLYVSTFDFTRPWMIRHLWSLSVEEQFYFLWPGVLRRYRNQTQILFAVILLSPICSSVCYYLRVPEGGYGTFPTVANMLAVGCLLAIFENRIPKIGQLAAGIMLIGVVLVPLYPGVTPVRSLFELFVLSPILHFSIAGLILYFVRRPNAILNWAPITRLGRLSYSLYLWQQPFFFDPHPASAYRPLIGLGLACVSYYVVERPMLELRDRKSRLLSANQPA